MSQLRKIKNQALQAERDVSTSTTQPEALEAAIRAAETYMNALNLTTDPNERKCLDAKCKEYITRAEQIKLLKGSTGASANTQRTRKEPQSTRSLSYREQIILLEDSKLNGFVFPPWSGGPGPEEFELDENGEPFSDCSELKLSKAQQKIFNGWKRPSEIFADAKSDIIMVSNEPMDLAQDVTTDCSVVASLCAGVCQNNDGHSQLVKSVKMYPSCQYTSIPQISLSGKYIFRMHFNGCYRKVVIDDRLPTSNSSSSLYVADRNCPTSIWPALVEKAYLKVRGGYDFPGSNSGTDMWILTGWIPEQIFLHHDEVGTDQLWSRLFGSFHSGNALLTIGTGKLTIREEKELGLISLHDYAILDMKNTSGKRQFLVKNPWAGGAVWRGLGGSSAISTPPAAGSGSQLSGRSSLSPGTFWIDCDEMLQNFENLYVNWDPCLFKYRQDIHFRWDLSNITPIPGSFTDSPQFAVTSRAGGKVWLLLNRHFKTEETLEMASQLLEFEGDSGPGFISIYVFDKKGQRVYLSDGALQRSPFVDSPNTLVRLDIPANTTYTAVIAEQSLHRSVHGFSLFGFSTSPLNIAPAAEKYTYVNKCQAAWTVSTAGGNAESENYPSNPQFKLIIGETCDVAVLLDTDNPELATHVKIFWSNGARVSEVRSRDIITDSGDYRRGVALAEEDSMVKGTYTIVCSTFAPGQLGKFTLRVSSTRPCDVKSLPKEGAGRLSINSGLGLFTPGTDRLLAPINVSRLSRLKLIARRKGSWIGLRPVAPSPILMTLELGQGPYKEILAASGDGDFSDSITGVRIENADLQPNMGFGGGIWLVVERVGGPGGQVEDHVEVEILSEERVEIGAWGVGDG
ncbi:cysteine protease [Ophidiomyces ophidiicola]|nr:cysteine protease [Ophidiomyces ophidiicola]KAI1991339.1 cysteine protease [Ophidiomyces ophidiicola]KAI1993341.1 cysteine protease [Ophidiomyces ophidiicola]KAI1999317.1 cysteine protease [Ophidiomyces ophidiicola]